MSVLLGNKVGVMVEEVKVREVVVLVKGVREEEGEEGEIGLALMVPGDVIGVVVVEEDKKPEPEFVGRTENPELLLNENDELGRMLLIPDVELKADTNDAVGLIIGGPSMILPVIVALPLGVGSRTSEGEVGLVLLVVAETFGKMPEDKAGSDVRKPLLMPLVIFPLDVRTLAVLIRNELLIEVEDKVGSAVGGPAMSVADGSPVGVGPALPKAVTPQQEQAEE
jgi:uncharacterized protein YodC (DUF2158 family)